MEYIHELDDEIVENIKMMLQSPDPDSVNLALGILNHTDLSNEKTKKYIIELVLDTDYGLSISFEDAHLLKNDVKLLLKETHYYMEEESLKENFKFYSVKNKQKI
jgi:hypothetical protein